MIDGCARCWEHGPFLPDGLFYTPEADRELHKSWHALVDSVGRTQPWQWMIDMSERAAHVLALPRRKP